MGLDLVPQSISRPGHEAEWRAFIERSFREEEFTDEEVERFGEIGIPPFANIGAPRVGIDKDANDWIIEQRQLKTEGEVEACLKEFYGHYAIELIGPPGVPVYTNGGAYDGIDRTSFRGAWLTSCEPLFGKKILEEAWEHRWPDEAISYGRTLLKIVGAAEAGKPTLHPHKHSFFDWFFKPEEPAPFSEQIDIVRAAGEWFVFWGERGHPIKAWY